MSKESSSKRGGRQGRPENIDRHVGARIRQRRIMLGLMQQLAELVGVTYQQAHKYEHGINEQERLMAAIIGLPPGLDAMMIRLRTLLWFKGIGDPGAVPIDPGPYETGEDKIVRRLCRDLAALSELLPTAEAGLVGALAADKSPSD
jgi:transcriptional regulator with XRE-family HTH domain